LREPRLVQLAVWEGFVDTGPGDDRFAGPAPALEGSRATRRIGERLHVAVVTIDSASLRPEQVYSYSLTFWHFEGGDDLKSLALLQDVVEEGASADDTPGRVTRLALGYAPRQLPSFALPPADLADLKIVQASCRRVQVKGADALTWLDDLIRRDRDDPGARPHQLFLTGDQIYADSVAVALLPNLYGPGQSPHGRHRARRDRRREPPPFPSTTPTCPPAGAATWRWRSVV
ncbi:MAG: hypothetical protein ACRDJN_16635, partial [Chloroflexota bacterium]